jgi:hypothetical protein
MTLTGIDSIVNSKLKSAAFQVCGNARYSQSFCVAVIVTLANEYMIHDGVTVNKGSGR